MRTRLIAGNWKMHKTVTEAVTFVHEFRKVLIPPIPPTAIDIVIAPPCVSLFAIQQTMTHEDRFALAAQNLHWEAEGAYTGEVSGPMLRLGLHICDCRTFGTPTTVWRMQRCGK